jgi:hypothetical protein
MRMLSRVIHESAINDSHDDTGEFAHNQDITWFEKPVAETVTMDEDEKGIVQDAIADANLTDWEKTVLEAFLNATDDKTGWQTDVAKNHINPLTGEAYTRAAPAVAFKRAMTKLRELYSRNELQAAG